MLEILLKILGLLGVGLIVAAYYLLQAGRVRSDSTPYHLLNAFGCILILGSLYVEWNLSAFVMEIVWLGITLYGMFKKKPVGL